MKSAIIATTSFIVCLINKSFLDVSGLARSQVLSPSELCSATRLEHDPCNETNAEEHGPLVQRSKAD